MRRERNHPLTNLAMHIQAALPRNAIKLLARGIGCSDRQAWRIVTTGKVPTSLEKPALDYLAEAIQRRKVLLEQAENDLKTIRYSRMVGRAESRLASPNTADSGGGAELDSRQPTLPLKDR